MTNNGGRSRGAECSFEAAHGGAVLPVDSLFELLADARRRHLLALLREHSDGAVTVDAAAQHVAAAVARGRGTRPDNDDVRVSLYHNHLPKLADAGVIEYDVRSRTIRYCPDERLEALHDCARELQQE